jgi:hypothetical protein
MQVLTSRLKTRHLKTADESYKVRFVANDPSFSPPIFREPLWAQGLRAARMNLIPGLIVQSLMLAVLLGYYFYPPLRHAFDRLGEIKNAWGYGYSILNAIVAGAIIPEVLRIVVFQKSRWQKTNAANLRFTIPFYAYVGLTVDLFYRCQTDFFGAEASFAVVVRKMLVDQFLYTPIIAVPVAVWLYDWKKRRYPLRGNGHLFTARYYRQGIFPTLFANWCVWIPLVSILYSLPPSLQIPLFGLALSLWVMIYTSIHE